MEDVQTIEKYIKTHGKTRKIVTYISPTCALRRTHEQINEMLAKSTYPSIFAKAYYPGKGIVDNAYTHFYGDIFIKLDIKDFFGSINHMRLERSLHMEINKRSKASHDQCWEIVNKCTCGYRGLPLGFVTSPLLSNIFLKSFDSLLYGYLRTLNLTHTIYTRYADDIIISYKYTSGYRFMADDIIDNVEWLLNGYNLRLNEKKTRIVNLLDTKHVKITGVNLTLMPNGDRKLTVGNALKNKLFWDAIDCYENPRKYSDFEVKRLNGLLSFVLSVEDDFQSCYSETMIALIRSYGFEDFQSFVKSLYNRNIEGYSPKKKHSSSSQKYRLSTEKQKDVKQQRNAEKRSFAELDSLIGLETVKDDVRAMVNFVKMQRARQNKGFKAVPVSLHLVFTGNPGTGKTTVARILGRIYKELGVLSKGQLIEVDRSGLVAGYVGQTAIKTKEKIDEAIGGILFIDEAYTLAKGGNDFGQEAIDTILKAMEDHRDDFIVIVAGYPELMEKFINSNPGLKSRFNKHFEFPDYGADELEQIFYTMCDNYEYAIDINARPLITEHMKRIVYEKGDNFANARDVRNYFETVISNQASRFMSSEAKDYEMNVITRDDL